METLILNFENHILNICSEVSRKLGDCRVGKSWKVQDVFKAFIESQFNYCPLNWMLHSRTMDNKINRLHERSLRIIYSDQSSSFEELLERDKSFSNHFKNIQSLYCVKSVKIRNFFSPNAGKYGLEKTPYLDTFRAVLAIEIYKYVKGLSPEIMNSLFH